MIRDSLARAFVTAERRLRRRKDVECQATLRSLERSPETLAEFQVSRLRGVLRAAARTPYFRSILKERGVSTDDFRLPEHLGSLPLLTKDLLQGRIDDLVDPEAPPQDRLPSQSGGSTGTPTVFYHDRSHHQWFHGANWLGLKWCGYRPGDRQTYFWGADFDAPAKTWRSELRQYLENNFFENAFQASEGRLDEYARRLAVWHPLFLWSYVSSAVLLARFARQKGIAIRFRAIRTTAETLTPAQRDLLESAFSARVYDQYGSRELGIVAQECEAHNGLHVFPHQWVELLPVAGADFGRLVVTDLTNEVLPFLRYDTGDLARWAEGACPCGRTWPRLERIVGRVSDVLVSPSGKYIHGEFFTHLFYKTEGVRQFQVIQEDRERLRIRIVFSDAAPSAREATIRFLDETILRYGDPGFRLEFETLERIEPSPSGKYRFTLSRLATSDDSRS